MNSTKTMPAPVDTTIPAAPSTQSLLCGLFRAYLGLETDQVVVYNQKWKIPADDRLYVCVASIGPNKPYGGTTEEALSPDGLGLDETVSVAMRELLSVDLYSSSQEAVDRKEEILMALRSSLAQQLAEAYSLRIAQIPLSFVDLSGVEGVARLNRFSITIAVLRTRSKTTRIESFATFPTPGLVLNP